MEPGSQREAFIHLRVLIGVVVGLSLTRLLLSLARFVQHPGHARAPAIWLGWAIFLLFAILHLWWLEFGLSAVRWRFELYAFTVIYASLYFFICAVLTPDSLDDYRALDVWFDARRPWFYGLLAALLLCEPEPRRCGGRPAAATEHRGEERHPGGGRRAERRPLAEAEGAAAEHEAEGRGEEGEIRSPGPRRPCGPAFGGAQHVARRGELRLHLVGVNPIALVVNGSRQTTIGLGTFRPTLAVGPEVAISPCGPRSGGSARRATA